VRPEHGTIFPMGNPTLASLSIKKCYFKYVFSLLVYFLIFPLTRANYVLCMFVCCLIINYFSLLLFIKCVHFNMHCVSWKTCTILVGIYFDFTARKGRRFGHTELFILEN